MKARKGHGVAAEDRHEGVAAASIGNSGLGKALAEDGTTQQDDRLSAAVLRESEGAGVVHTVH